jgi:hypothetical protein
VRGGLEGGANEHIDEQWSRRPPPPPAAGWEWNGEPKGIRVGGAGAIDKNEGGAVGLCGLAPWRAAIVIWAKGRQAPYARFQGLHIFRFFR